MSKKTATFAAIAAMTAMWSARSSYMQPKQLYGSPIYIPKRHKKKKGGKR